MANENTDSKTVFKKAVNDWLSAHPNSWTGEASAAVVRILITNLKDGKGNAITLTAEEDDVIEIASHPTQEVQMRVVQGIIERHDVQLDAATQKLIRRVVGATAFRGELVKAGKIKDSGAEELGDLLG